MVGRSLFKVVGILLLVSFALVFYGCTETNDNTGENAGTNLYSRLVLTTTPTTGRAPLYVVVSADVEKPEGCTIGNFEWDFNYENNQFDADLTTEENWASYNYPSPGTYYIAARTEVECGDSSYFAYGYATVNVWSGGSESGSATLFIDLKEMPSGVLVPRDEILKSEIPLSFRALAVVSGFSHSVGYVWRIKDASGATVATATSSGVDKNEEVVSSLIYSVSSITVEIRSPGDYVVELEVKDPTSGVKYTTSRQITATPNNPPSAEFYPSRTSGTAPLAVTLYPSGAGDASGVSNCEWDFDYTPGDFTTDATSPVVGNGCATIDHVFTSPGVYTVALKVTDNLGSYSISQPWTITVYPPARENDPEFDCYGMTGGGGSGVELPVLDHIYVDAGGCSSVNFIIPSFYVLSGSSERTVTGGFYAKAHSPNGAVIDRYVWARDGSEEEGWENWSSVFEIRDESGNVVNHNYRISVTAYNAWGNAFSDFYFVVSELPFPSKDPEAQDEISGDSSKSMPEYDDAVPFSLTSVSGEDVIFSPHWGGEEYGFNKYDKSPVVIFFWKKESGTNEAELKAAFDELQKWAGSVKTIAIAAASSENSQDGFASDSDMVNYLSNLLGPGFTSTYYGITFCLDRKQPGLDNKTVHEAYVYFYPDIVTSEVQNTFPLVVLIDRNYIVRRYINKVYSGSSSSVEWHEGVYFGAENAIRFDDEIEALIGE